MISANQPSIYGAKPKGIRDPVKLAAPGHLEKVGIPTDHSIAGNSTNAQQRVKPSARIRAEVRAIVRIPEIIQTMF